jgi:hypothetical protein
MRRAFKVLLWGVLGPLSLVLLLALAWVACNGRWADAAPQPVPPALMPLAVTLAPADNAFFDTQGLRAPAGESPNEWGQRSWRGELEGDPKLLAIPGGDDWNCSPLKTDCIARWQASAVALRAQMAETRAFGERCLALADRSGFQEPVRMRRAQPSSGKSSAAASALPHFAPASHCLRWLQIEAVLAQDPQRARDFLGRADGLLRLMASGAQTLLGQAVSWSWAERHQLLLAQWAARQPLVDPLPAAWLAPLPARVLQPRLWIASESQFQGDTVAELAESPAQMLAMDPSPLQAWAGRHGLGYLPELTVQAMDAYWLADLQSYGQLQGPALAEKARRKRDPAASWWRYVSWRNSVGHILVEVGRPFFERYALRQADLVLYQAALALSQQLNGVPAVERAGWWERQPLDAGIRARLSLEGDALVVRSWRSEIQPNEIAPVRFPLRPA